MKIALVGAASSRKSTVAYRLVAEFKMRGESAVLVPEYARTYIECYGPITHPLEQFAIFEGQVAAERVAVRNYGVCGHVVCDSAPWLSLLYWNQMVREIPTHLSNSKRRDLGRQLADICEPTVYEPDLIFLLEPATFVHDGVRLPETDSRREVLYHAITGYLDGFDLDGRLVKVGGTTDERVDAVLGRIFPKGA